MPAALGPQPETFARPEPTAASPQGPDAPLRGLRARLACRSTRVLILLFVVVALSLADLYLTLLYSSTIGLPELNPVARTLMRHGTAADLILWKLGTVALSVGILIRLRQARAAEIGAWIAFAALCWLTVQWIAYANLHSQIAEVGSSIDYSLAHGYEPNWVELGSHVVID